MMITIADNLRNRGLTIALLTFAGTLQSLAGAPAGAQSPARKTPTTAPAVALKREIESARKAGYPVTARELQRPLPSRDQNAATIYRQWYAVEIRGNGITKPEQAILAAALSASAKDRDFEASRALFKRRQDLVDLIDRALARPQCNYALNYDLSILQGFNEWLAMTRMNQLLMAESALALHDGKPLDAIHFAEKGFRIVDHCQQSAGDAPARFAFIMDSQVLKRLGDVLFAAGDDAEVRTALMQALDRRPAPLKSSDVLKCYIVEALGSCEMLRWRPDDWNSDRVLATTEYYGPRSTTNHPVGNVIDLINVAVGTQQMISFSDTSDEITPVVLPIVNVLPPRSRAVAYNEWVDTNAAEAVHDLHLILDAADKPFNERIGAGVGITAGLTAKMLQEFSGGKKDIDSAPANTVVACLYSENAVEFLRERNLDYDQANADVLRAGIRLCDYKARTGAFPETLEAAIASPPMDPFDEKPLKYRREGAGFVVYAVGRNHDYNGAPDKSSDSSAPRLHYPRPMALPLDLSTPTL